MGLDAPERLREAAVGVIYVDGMRDKRVTRRPPPDLVYTLVDKASLNV
jgi:hypothetical protein